MRVAIERLTNYDYFDPTARAMEWIRWETLIASQARVYIKPNFTYPTYNPGVTTSLSAIEALVQVLKTHTSHITIVESDGGNHAWQAQEAFAGHGLEDIRKKYGVRLVNLSDHPVEIVETTVAGKRIQVSLSSMMLHEADVFITMPVPKVHVMTTVSLGFKNQWGCLPDAKRIRNHPEFNFKVVAINKLLRTRIAVFDGTYFLNRTGPMSGDAVRKNLIIAADDIGAGSLVCCEIMGIDYRRVGHFKVAQKEGMFPRSLQEIELNQSLATFQDQHFYLKRTLLNWMAWIAFRSHLGTTLIYDSYFATPIHQLLYLIRGRPAYLAGNVFKYQC